MFVGARVVFGVDACIIYTNISLTFLATLQLGWFLVLKEGILLFAGLYPDRIIMELVRSVVFWLCASECVHVLWDMMYFKLPYIWSRIYSLVFLFGTQIRDLSKRVSSRYHGLL